MKPTRIGDVGTRHKTARTNGCTPRPRTSLGQWSVNSSGRVILAVIPMKTRSSLSFSLAWFISFCAGFPGAVSAESPGSELSVIQSVDNFEETGAESPRWSTNGRAVAEVSNADTGSAASKVLAVTYNNRPAGGAAVIFPVEDVDLSRATGIRFSIKGNADAGTRCDLVVNVKDLAGKRILYHSNTLDTEETIQLDADGWRDYYFSLEDYAIPPMFLSNLESIAFFFFGETDTKSPVLIDNVAFVDNPADVPAAREHDTAALSQPPRLFFDGAGTELRVLREKIRDGVPRQAFEILHARAEKYLELPTTPYTAFKISGGDSFHFQGRITQTHVTELAFVGLLLDDERYQRKAIDILLSCAKQAGPAEIDAMHKIGLENGDLAMAFALGYDLLNAAMTDEERLLIKNELYEYGAWIFEHSPSSHWGGPTSDTMISNWNAVIHGPLGLIGLLLDRRDWVALAGKRVEGYLHHALDETACREKAATTTALVPPAPISLLPRWNARRELTS